MTARLTDEQKIQRAAERAAAKIEKAHQAAAADPNLGGPVAVEVDGVKVAETRHVEVDEPTEAASYALRPDSLKARKATAKKAAPAAKKAAAPAAKKAEPKKASKPAERRPVVVSEGKLNTDAETLPTDLASLRTLLKISRDRRWRAGRRDDAALVADMSKRIEKIEKAIKAATPKVEKAAPVKVASKPAAKKAEPKKAAARKPAASKATASK
jgi:hypothetical protein